jgi:hypothetical protein
MTAWNDLPDEMRGERIDAGTMDRLLRGRIPPDDAPPGYSDVASVLLAAASPTGPEEIAMEHQHVVAAKALVETRTTGHRSARRFIAGAALAGALLVLPGLAAANVLPDPAQHAVSSVLDKVGISVPSGGQDPANTGDHPASTGAEISHLATTTDTTGVAKGAEISTLASGGKSQAGQHGQAATGGAGNGVDASAQGRATAATASDGHSTGGHAPSSSGAVQTHP